MTQYYIYWHPGEEKPKKTPENAEFSTAGGPSLKSYVKSKDWECESYRYPVTEEEYRAHCYCQAHDITIPEGEKVTGFRHPNRSEWFLTTSGNVCQHNNELWCGSRVPILESIWITPTDNDARRRPMVQVRFNETIAWEDRILVAVVAGLFYVMKKEHNGVEAWSLCRMKREEEDNA
jgi:hypothetical protein